MILLAKCSNFGRVVLGLAISLILTSCAADSSFGLDDPTRFEPNTTSCFSELQCGFGQQCIDGICQIPSFPAGQILYVVETDQQSQYVTSHFVGTDDESNDSMVRLKLASPVSFPYQILDANGLRISADMTITGKNRVPGREEVHGETYLASRSAQLKLLPGDYRIRFVPSDESAPGVDSEFTVKETTLAKEFSLAMTYRKIKGRVYQRSDSNVPLEGVLVRAYSQTSGLLSSNSISDRLGSYEVLLPDTQDTSFRVIAEWPDSTQPAWRFEQNIRVERGEDRQLDIGFTQTMPDQQGHAQIRFLGDGDRGPEPITKANVTLTASAAFDTQTYKLVAMTDDDGYVVIPKTTGNERPNLVAATYEIEIIPPSGSIFARSKQALDLNRVGPSNTADKHIALAKRVYVSGAVASARGELVAGANIVVTYQTKSSELPSPGVVINTKADGSFNAWLDPGDYLFRVTPPPEDSRSNTESPKAFQLITIPSDVPGHMLAPFYLSEGSVIQGEVVGAANEIIGNGSVETFIQLEDLDTPVSLGIQSLDRFGRFEAFVPSK